MTVQHFHDDLCTYTGHCPWDKSKSQTSFWSQDIGMTVWVAYCVPQQLSQFYSLWASFSIDSASCRQGGVKYQSDFCPCNKWLCACILNIVLKINPGHHSYAKSLNGFPSSNFHCLEREDIIMSFHFPWNSLLSVSQDSSVVEGLEQRDSHTAWYMLQWKHQCLQHLLCFLFLSFLICELGISVMPTI